MKLYEQITYEERLKIGVLLKSESSITEIARALGRSKSTISREIKRNKKRPLSEYWPDSATQMAHERRLRGCLIDKNEKLREFILTKLTCHYWTPEQIAAALKYREKKLPSVCFETIYRWIYSKSLRGEKLWKFLPRHKAKRGLRHTRSAGISRILHRISIHDRPKSIDKRLEFGHWEGDLVSFRKSSQHMVVLMERKTMMTLSAVLPGKHAETTAQSVIELLKKLPEKARKSLTLDNGGEFARHYEVAETLGLQTYFCDPYASWQKGGIENTNGRLRRDLPRKTDIKSMDKENFDENLENYNTTPRKKLGWLTPLEVFNKNLYRVALRT